MSADDSFFIASTTKLFITATMLKLRERSYIQLTDPISRYLDSDLISGIHRFQGTDYSRDITIKQLMAHTSGLPDYFQQKKATGSSLQDDIVGGHDQAWSFTEMLEDVKLMKPHFPPGQSGRALYSDTNYQLLGKIIEQVTEENLEDVFQQFIYEPLELTNTYMFANGSHQTPAPLYYKRTTLHIPQAMASFGPDGGIVSTAKEMMRFLRAFFEGELFPKSYLTELCAWNRIFFPLQYGVGIAKFQLPRIFSPFKTPPELIGHSGLSGAFAYYCPEKDLYLTGTVNQIANPGLSYKLMLRIVHAA